MKVSRLQLKGIVPFLSEAVSEYDMLNMHNLLYLAVYISVSKPDYFSFVFSRW